MRKYISDKVGAYKRLCLACSGPVEWIGPDELFHCRECDLEWNLADKLAPVGKPSRRKKKTRVYVIRITSAEVTARALTAEEARVKIEKRLKRAGLTSIFVRHLYDDAEWNEGIC